MLGVAARSLHAPRRGASLRLLGLSILGLSALTTACRGGGAAEMPLPEKETKPAAYSDIAFAQALERVDDEGLVDYAAFVEDDSDLTSYYATLANLAPDEYERWDDNEQIAFWSNAYNALTLLAITRNYPIERSASVGAMMHPKGIRWIPGVWDKLTFTIMGREMTLNDIEHQVLRVEYDEPRIHAALVCAAISCPPLRNEPFTGGRLDEQFDDQTRRFIERAGNFKIDRDAGKVYLSKILDWYGGDFEESFEPEEGYDGQSDTVRAVLNFIAGYLSDDDRQYLRSGVYDIDYLGYDWALNDRATAD